MFTLTPDDPHSDATVQVYKRETLCNRQGARKAERHSPDHVPVVFNGAMT